MEASNERNKCPAALSTAGVVVAMSATSLLFAWQATRTLRRCGAMAEEKVFSGVLWGLSPLISAYLQCWTLALSPASRAKVAGGVVRLVPTCAAACLLVLAVAADKLVDAPAAGAAAFVLAPLLTACACGGALAARLHRAGAEPWCAAAAASTSIYQSRAEELEEREHRASAVFALTTMTTVVPVSLCFLTWIAPPGRKRKWPEPPPPDVVFYLAGPMFVAARLMLSAMVRSPVLAAVDDMVALAAVIGVFGWLVIAGVVTAFFATVAGTVVVWMGELAMVGVLGYFLAVETHYKELMINKRKEPRRAKDASGLLDGRDSGDACSAHIDVDAAAATSGGPSGCVIQ